MARTNLVELNIIIAWPVVICSSINNPLLFLVLVGVLVRPVLIISTLTSIE